MRKPSAAGVGTPLMQLYSVAFRSREIQENRFRDEDDDHVQTGPKSKPPPN